MSSDRSLAVVLVLVASGALLYGGHNLGAAIKSAQTDRQHTLDCAEQGRPAAACCRSRLDPGHTSCPLPGNPHYQVIP